MTRKLGLLLVLAFMAGSLSVLVAAHMFGADRPSERSASTMSTSRADAGTVLLPTRERRSRASDSETSEPPTSADVDLEPALAQIARAESPQAGLALALAVLRNADDPSSLIERIAAASSTFDVIGLRMAWIQDRAANDPSGALQDALALRQPRAKRIALGSVAETAGAIDPARAAALAQSIADRALRNEFLATVSIEWALHDVDGFLDRFATLDIDRPSFSMGRGSLGRALLLAAEQDPMRVLAAAEHVDGALRTTARQAGLAALAAVDPDAALAVLESFASIERSEPLLQALAQGYAQFDLNAAVEWASGLGDDTPAIQQDVYQAVAAVDLMRAIELTLGNARDGASSTAANVRPTRLDVRPTWLGMSLYYDLDNPALIADRLAASELESADGLLATVVYQWGRVDPVGALAWMQSTGHLGNALVEGLAETFGRRDLVQALSAASTLPAQARAHWIEAAIGSASSTAPRAAFDALAAYRGEPFYESLLTTVTLNAAIGPAGTAGNAQSVLNLIGGDVPPPVAAIVAGAWAREDPEAAGQWASSLLDSAARQAAIQAVVTTWAKQDAQAALRMAAGEADPRFRQTLIERICSGPVAEPECE